MDFTKASRVSTSTRDLTGTASYVSGQNRDRSLSQVVVPDDVRQSMWQQGMQTNTPFSPGVPINPTEPVGSDPQQFEFMIGQNIVQRPRSNERVSFDTMRNLIENYDIAQMCIEVRLDQLRNLDWAIVRSDKKDKADYSSDIKKVENFFRKPDGMTLFDDWLNPITNDLLSFDAPAIYKERTRGGKLGALEVLDGTTLTPMVDDRGRLPRTPAPAYVQYTYGMPRYWLTADSVIYRPWRRRSRSIYGFPAVEWLLMNINQDVRQQYYFLQYFTDGSVPDVFAEAPAEAGADPEQIRLIQEYYDAVMVGDQSQKHKVKWVPAGSKITMMKDAKFQMDYPMLLFNKTLAAFKVTPAELGFTEKVNKSSGESQENVQYRRAIRPIAKYFKSIFDEIIRELGFPHLEWEWQNLGEQEDMLVAAQVREIDIRNGVISPDYAAEEVYGITPDPSNPTPRVFIFTSGVATVEDAIEQGKAQTQLTLAQAEQAKSSAKKEKPEQDPDDDGQRGEREPDASEAGGDSPKNQPRGKIKELKDVPAVKLAKADGEDDDEEQKYVLPLVDEAALSKKAEALQDVLTSFFQTQPEKIAKHVLDGISGEKEDLPVSVDDLLHSYGWQGWEKHLKPSVVKAITESAEQGGVEGAAAVEVNLTYAMINPHAVDYANARAAELIGTGKNTDFQIAESTRNFIRETVTNAVAEGMSMQDLTAALTDEYAFSEERAMTIARTETGMAYNKGTLIGYQLADVPAVTVIDGDSDVECSAANGQAWSLDYAQDNLLQHPRCVRHFAGIPKAWFDGNYDME